MYAAPAEAHGAVFKATTPFLELRRTSDTCAAQQAPYVAQCKYGTAHLANYLWSSLTSTMLPGAPTRTLWDDETSAGIARISGFCAGPEREHVGGREGEGRG